ncbi:MAG TPA: four helix bundle protein, partial [Gallicola sp.]|nr:four helix bundle protein [Gallicola sp.]
MQNREYHRYPFEKLEVWQQAKDFAKEVYFYTKKLPSEEKYGLVSQLNRAALSVSSNIAEGASRKSSK